MQVEQIIIVFHVLIALTIIGLILLQQGKGSEMGASFGSGSSQTVFGGAGGGNVLTNATAVLAALFFLSSFALAVVAKNHANSTGSVEFAVPALVESEEGEARELPAAQPDDAFDAEIPELDDGGTGEADSELPPVE